MGGFTLYFTINGTGFAISIGSSANILAHYVYSWDGSVVRVYKNGNFVNSVNFSTFTNTVIGSTTNIGAVAANPTYRPLAQDFYLLRNYNRALTAAEILQNYNAVKTRFGL